MLFRRQVGLGLAATMLGMAAARAQVVVKPRWHAGDPAPDVEGVHLGDTREQVLAALGPPDADPAANPAMPIHRLTYRGGGLQIAVDGDGKVMGIMLRTPQAGALAGIRPGDRLGQMVAAWGEPTVSQGMLGRYLIGDWVINAIVDFGEQKVVRLSLSRRRPASTIMTLPSVAPAAPSAPQP